MKKAILLAVIVCLCAGMQKKMEKAAGKTFSVYPMAEGKEGDKNCRDFIGTCMIFQTDEPLFQLSGFSFRPVPTTKSGKHNQIELFLSTAQASAFEAIPEKYIGEGKRLGLVYEGKILHAPKIKVKIRTSALVIDFCNSRLYQIVLASLRGQTPPDYKLGDDKAWNMCDPLAEK